MESSFLLFQYIPALQTVHRTVNLPGTGTVLASMNRGPAELEILNSLSGNMVPLARDGVNRELEQAFQQITSLD